MKPLNFVIIVIAIAVLAGMLNVYNVNNEEVYAQNLTTNTLHGMTQTANNETSYSSDNNNNSILDSYQKSQTFIHGIVVKIDNVGYYFDGPADGANGTKDA